MNPQILITCIQINLLRCPLMRPETVQDCLGKSREQVNAMIDSGELPFAFDLSANPKARKEPRIFSLCVAEKQAGKMRGGRQKIISSPKSSE